MVLNAIVTEAADLRRTQSRTATELMPSFIVIGAGKSGTTSLYHCLRRHPQIFMSPVKEPLFFAFAGRKMNFIGPGDAEINARAVTQLSAYQRLFSSGSNHPARGEASVAYLYYPRAADLIRELLPDIKLVVILRCPADRAYSNFLHALRLGREPIWDFERALALEPERIKAGWSHFYHYKSKGFYYRQLSYWMSLFSSDQIMVHLYDDWNQAPDEFLRRILHFVGVDSEYSIHTSQRYNVTGQSPTALRVRKTLAPLSRLSSILPVSTREYLKGAIARCGANPNYMPADIHKRLMDEYAPDVAKLSNLIGRDLSGWFTPRQQQY
jgi:hypothetical protein